MLLNARWLVTFFVSGILVCSGREKALKGTAMQNLAIFELPEDNQEVGVGSGWSVAVDKEGRIAAIGTDHEVDSRMEGCSFEQCINVLGMSTERDTTEVWWMHIYTLSGWGTGYTSLQ